MDFHRILVYSDTISAAATMQIRLIAPLQQAGFELVDAHQFLQPNGNFEAQIASNFAAIIIHRGIKKRCEIYSEMIAAAHKLRIPVILDIDDLLIGVPQTHPDFKVYQSRIAQALKVLFDSDLVAASTGPLASQLSAFHPSVEVVPNELPSSIWGGIRLRNRIRLARIEENLTTIGYIGSATHAPDLSLVEDSILEVLHRHRGRVRFVTVGVPLPAKLQKDPDTQAIRLDKWVSQDYAKFATFVASLRVDIGIAPLRDNEFNRCKSDIKFQEYAALGIAGVYSDIAPYRDSVRHRDNGILVAGLRDWRPALEELLTTNELRNRIVTNSSNFLDEKWKRGQSSQKWKNVIGAASLAIHSDAPRVVHPMTTVLNDMIDYQSKLERQVKRSIQYQAGKILTRMLRRG